MRPPARLEKALAATGIDMKQDQFEEFAGSTKFHHVGKVEFWLTELNHVFLLIAGQVIFPSLHGRKVTYDDPHYQAPLKVTEDLARILHKQREIRMGWPAQLAADELAFQNE